MPGPRIKPKVAGAGGVFKLMQMSKRTDIDLQRKAEEKRRIARGLDIERQRRAEEAKRASRQADIDLRRKAEEKKRSKRK